MEAQYTIILFLLVIGVLLGSLYMMESFMAIGKTSSNSKGFMNQLNEGLGITPRT